MSHMQSMMTPMVAAGVLAGIVVLALLAAAVLGIARLLDRNPVVTRASLLTVVLVVLAAIGLIALVGMSGMALMHWRMGAMAC
jgi:hypothetical protein